MCDAVLLCSPHHCRQAKLQYLRALKERVERLRAAGLTWSEVEKAENLHKPAIFSLFTLHDFSARWLVQGLAGKVHSSYDNAQELRRRWLVGGQGGDKGKR